MFDLEKFFNTIFKPQAGDKVAVMCDLPHAESLPDNEQWKARRAMAAEWVEKLSLFPSLSHVQIRPLATYLATKGNNQDLPATCSLFKCARWVIGTCLSGIWSRTTLSSLP